MKDQVHFSHWVLSDSLWLHGLQLRRLPCPSPAPEACSNSSPSSRWCHPTVSSFVIPFSSCLESFPEFPILPSLLQWISYLHQVAKVLEFQLQHQSFQWIFRARISNPSQSSPMNQLFASGGQSIGVSASTSVLPMNIQGWFPLGLTGGSPCSPRDSQESSPTPQFKCNSSVLSILAWRSPWTVEPIGSQRIRHEWVTFTHTLTSLSVLYGPVLISTQVYWT